MCWFHSLSLRKYVFSLFPIPWLYVCISLFPILWLYWGWGWFSYFCPHEPPQFRSVAQSCPSLCHPMNCLRAWNRILKQRILTPSRWRTNMFYCWRLNAFLIADKPSSEPSKVGDFPPSVSFYRGVNSIEQERNALLLGRKRAGST